MERLPVDRHSCRRCSFDLCRTFQNAQRGFGEYGQAAANWMLVRLHNDVSYRTLAVNWLKPEEGISSNELFIPSSYHWNIIRCPVKDDELSILLLVSVLTQSFLPLVSSDFVAFTLFSARHNKISFTINKSYFFSTVPRGRVGQIVLFYLLA